jgi:hypothetical protein
VRGRLVRVDHFDDSELLELLDGLLDLELGQPRVRRELLLAEAAVDAREEKPVRRVELELANVDVRDEPRHLLRHRPASISAAVGRPLFPCRGLYLR